MPPRSNQMVAALESNCTALGLGRREYQVNLLLTRYDHVQEVRRALGCSHSLAYEHLRRAAGREPTARAACLQPTRHVERYAKENGRRVTRSTKCRDRSAAERVARQ